jgi:hypothetical protein
VIKPGTDLQSILMKHPDFSDFTYRKNGSVKSFAYGSERVRLTTLHGFMVDLLDDLAPPMIAPPTPALPVPAPASPLSPAAPPLPQPESRPICTDRTKGPTRATTNQARRQHAGINS